ncbi:iron ABC transporter permease [Marinomonas sp. C2222]|uniref:Iron ABC transporter permease n=1 Tax=Marinomonas sargassi TaxID=2984494 RepID=A0ABT2YNR0_9GAMM|nr:iron ABC transporter permease [Marinomonas sargassi]MCV2401476.1 iron ABC transporter permease [Marinomonas sargassi]
MAFLFHPIPSQRPMSSMLVPVYALFVLCCFCSLLFGAGSVSPMDAVQVLLGQGTDEAIFVVHELRLPRTIIGLIAGVCLGVSGVLMQSVTRNPLAEPGLLGVSAGSAFSVALALALGMSVATLPIELAQVGALVGCFFVIGIAKLQGQRNDPIRLVLAGAALTSLLTALTSLLLMYNEFAADEIRFWITGSIAGKRFDQLVEVVPSLVIASLCSLYIVRPLASLILGENVAIGLGYRPQRVRLIVVFVVALLVGTSTAIAGPIIFVGLVVPFVARALVGTDIRRTLWLCLPLGPLMIISADILSRLIAQPTEMPLGVLTAIIGAPVLLLIVRAQRLPTL